MTLRSVDMQILVQKALELAKNQYQEGSKIQSQQQQIAQQVQNNSARGDMQVNNLQGTYKGHIEDKRNKDQKEKEKGKKGHGKRRKQDGSGTIIDIKI